MKLLFALGLVLTCALAIQASLLSHHGHAGNDIEALCARKSVDLSTFSQLKQLGQAVGSSACSSTLKEAIPELVQLIDNGKDDLCSVETIGALRAYYGKYLDTSNGLDEDKELLPKSLKRFVLAYGMQMSNLCKKNMISVLSNEGNSLVDASDFEQLDTLINDKGPIAQFMDVIGGPGEVILPGDLIPLLQKRAGVDANAGLANGDKLVMQTATSDYIKSMQSVCQRRFKPIYEPLMIPLVRLVNLGMDYKDEQLKSDLKSDMAHDVNKWSRIVFLCEALANVRIVAADSTRNADQTEADGSSLVRILTKEEADASEGGEAIESETLKDQVLVYTPLNKVKLGDEIYNKADKQLHKSIKSFKTSHDEQYILKKRLTKKGFELIKKQLKGGHFGFILSAAWKGMVRKNKAVDSPAKQLVETLNEIVEQQATGSSDGAVSIYDEDRELLIFAGRVALLVVVLGIFTIIGLIGTGVIG